MLKHSKNRHAIDAAELLRQLMKPICGVLQAGRESNESKVQMYGQDLVQILEVNGWNQEAKLVSKACG